MSRALDDVAMVGSGPVRQRFPDLPLLRPSRSASLASSTASRWRETRASMLSLARIRLESPWRVSVEKLSGRWERPNDTGENLAGQVFIPALTDARQRATVRQGLVQGIADDTADREIDPSFSGSTAGHGQPRAQTRPHQPQGGVGIDARAAIVGTLTVDHLSAKPPRERNLTDRHQHMIIGDRNPQ